MKTQIIDQANFEHSPLENTFEKQTKKQIGAIKSLDPYKKLRQIEGIFPQILS